MYLVISEAQSGEIIIIKIIIIIIIIIGLIIIIIGPGEMSEVANLRGKVQ